LAELGLLNARSTGADRERTPAPASERTAPGGELGRSIVARLAHEPAAIDALLNGAAHPSVMLACIGELLTAGSIIESDDALLRVPR
jgi:hypothetical protein